MNLYVKDWKDYIGDENILPFIVARLVPPGNVGYIYNNSLDALAAELFWHGCVGVVEYFEPEIDYDFSYLALFNFGGYNLPLLGQKKRVLGEALELVNQKAPRGKRLSLFLSSYTTEKETKNIIKSFLKGRKYRDFEVVEIVRFPYPPDVPDPSKLGFPPLYSLGEEERIPERIIVARRPLTNKDMKSEARGILDLLANYDEFERKKRRVKRYITEVYSPHAIDKISIVKDEDSSIIPFKDLLEYNPEENEKKAILKHELARFFRSNFRERLFE